MSGSAEDRPDLGERFESARGATPLPTVALGMQLALSSTGLLEQRIWGSASRTQILRRLGILDKDSWLRTTVVRAINQIATGDHRGGDTALENAADTVSLPHLNADRRPVLHF